MTPIPKVDNPMELRDLRPSSALPVLSKVWEKVVYKQSFYYLDIDAILSFCLVQDRS